MKKKDPSDNDRQLGRLLERYKTILKPPQASVEKECIVVIEELTGIVLRPHQVRYTVPTRTLTIKAPSILRSELSLHKAAILNALKKRLGHSTTPTTII
jgi:hypothetical protein